MRAKLFARDDAGHVLMIVLTPADLEARAAPLIGCPFSVKGDTPDGWDCRGLVRWCWSEFLGVALPHYRDLYDAGMVTTRRRRERAQLIADGLAAWRPIAPQPGAVAWLEWMGTAGHVGFMISPRRVLHADVRGGTTLLDLDDPAAGYRLRGAFVPDFVTALQPS